MTPQQQADRFRNILAMFLVVSFVLILPLFVFWGMPATSKDIVTYMVGQLSGMATMALGFYFTNKVGQDAADAQKAENTGKALEAITATVKATGKAEEPDVLLRPGETAKAPDA